MISAAHQRSTALRAASPSPVSGQTPVNALPEPMPTTSASQRRSGPSISPQSSLEQPMPCYPTRPSRGVGGSIPVRLDFFHITLITDVLISAIPTSLTQEIVVDDETLIYLIYELDRTTGAMPSAQLLGYQNRKNPAKPPSQPHPVQAYPAAHPTSYPAYPSASLPRRTTQTTSLASALIPPNNLRHPSVNSMAF